MENNKNLIFLRGEFNPALVKFLKEALRLVNLKKEIVIRVNSHGGNVHSMNVMSAFLYYLIKYYKVVVKFEIEHIESAALMFAINFPIRIANPQSTGSIHLPVLRKDQHSYQNKEEEAISFISSRTKLTKFEVKKLNGTKLDSEKLYQFGIATEFVQDFL